MLEQENNDPREIAVTKAHIHAIEQEQKTRGITSNTVPKGVFQPHTTEAKDFKEAVENARGRQHYAPSIITHNGVKFFKADGSFGLGESATRNAEWLLTDGATTVFIIQLKSRLRSKKTPTNLAYFSPQIKSNEGIVTSFSIGKGGRMMKGSTERRSS